MVWFTKCQQIYEKPWLLPQCETHGMTLRRSRAMSGFAGLPPSRNRRQENTMSSEHARSLSKENAGLVVGQAALIVEISGGARLAHLF